MKHLSLLVCLLSGIFSSLWASDYDTFPSQHLEMEHDARTFVGGALTYWNNQEDHSHTFNFYPEVGRLFNETWGVGVMLGFGKEKESDGTKTTSYKIAPFARYYYVHKGPFNLFMDGGVGYSYRKTSESTEKRNGYEIGVRPGACVDLTEGLCLCLRMGFVGYRNHYTGGEEAEIGNSGWGIRFAPEELMIGLELEF